MILGSGIKCSEHGANKVSHTPSQIEESVFSIVTSYAFLVYPHNIIILFHEVELGRYLKNNIYECHILYLNLYTSKKINQGLSRISTTRYLK